MKQATLLIAVILLLTGCSSSGGDGIVKAVGTLNNGNSVVDTMIALSTGDSYGSLRNQVDEAGEEAFEIVKQLFKLEKASVKPSIASFTYFIDLSFQKNDDPNLYTIHLMIDETISLVQITGLQSSEVTSSEYNGIYTINAEMKLALNNIFEALNKK